VKSLGNTILFNINKKLSGNKRVYPMNPAERNDYANTILDKHNLNLIIDILYQKQNNWNDILQLHAGYCSLNNKFVQYI